MGMPVYFYSTVSILHGPIFGVLIMSLWPTINDLILFNSHPSLSHYHVMMMAITIIMIFNLYVTGVVNWMYCLLPLCHSLQYLVILLLVICGAVGSFPSTQEGEMTSCKTCTLEEMLLPCQWPGCLSHVCIFCIHDL